MNKSRKDFRERFRRFTSVVFDAAEWPISLPQNFADLVSAVDIADEIFWQQMSAQYDRSTILQYAADDEELRDFILFNYGPYDRLDNDNPFIPVDSKFPGVTFYPQNFTRQDFICYVQSHPESRSAFESPYTVIQRTNSDFKAIPYHEIYQDEVRSLSGVLKKASKLEPNIQFRKYLSQRARDILTDNYYESDKLWVGLTDNPVDLVIGPYEVYEDQLMGLKAAYEAVLLAHDVEGSKEIRHYQNEIRSLSRSLEPELGNALDFEDSRVQLSVARLMYAGGEGRAATPAIAFTLPNDERVIEEVGSRQIILKNVLEAKFKFVAWPMLVTLFPDTRASEDATFLFFFNHTLFHEISHSIGPQRIIQNGSLTTVNRSLREHYSVLEEAKADALATCFLFFTQKDTPESTFTEIYVSGLIRAIRFGLSSAHGVSNALQLNFLLRERTISFEDGRIRIQNNKPTLRHTIFKLAAKIIDIQQQGDFEGAKEFVQTYHTLTVETLNFLDSVRHVPTDIRIRYTNSLSSSCRLGKTG